MKNRIKSYSFWTALSGAAIVLLNALGDCFGFSINDELVKGLIMAVAGILVVLGVVTMPPKEENKDNMEQDALEVQEQEKEENSNQEETKIEEKKEEDK